MNNELPEWANGLDADLREFLKKYPNLLKQLEAAIDSYGLRSGQKFTISNSKSINLKNIPAPRPRMEIRATKTQELKKEVTHQLELTLSYKNEFQKQVEQKIQLDLQPQFKPPVPNPVDRGL